MKQLILQPAARAGPERTAFTLRADPAFNPGAGETRAVTQETAPGLELQPAARAKPGFPDAVGRAPEARRRTAGSLTP